MSRVGKNPVVVPQGVTIDLKGQALKVKGKRGELSLLVHDDVSVSKDGDKYAAFRIDRATGKTWTLGATGKEWEEIAEPR